MRTVRTAPACWRSGSAAGTATVIPARRACRVDPAITLRED
jgi:hypothetical protein